MVIITFPDEATQQKALGFLLRHFSGTVLKSGEHIVPEASLEALVRKGFQFAVHGTVTDEQRKAMVRKAIADADQ
jgi:hypothetical protein